jgi:hypothetical protein
VESAAAQTLSKRPRDRANSLGNTDTRSAAADSVEALAYEAEAARQNVRKWPIGHIPSSSALWV